MHNLILMLPYPQYTHKIDYAICNFFYPEVAIFAYRDRNWCRIEVRVFDYSECNSIIRNYLVASSVDIPFNHCNWRLVKQHAICLHRVIRKQYAEYMRETIILEEPGDY